MNLENLGFKKLNYDEQCKLNSAGAGFLSVLSTIGKTILGLIPTITSGANSAMSIFSNASTIKQQDKLIEKIKEITKGEIEFGKDGQIKIKWDDSSNKNPVIPTNNIIF